MEIAPGIHNVITEPAPAIGVTNTYLVVGAEGAVWIDTGWDREGEAKARIDYWQKVGSPPLRGIVVTHRHPPHWGNAPAIQRITGAPIIATATERDAIQERMTAAKVDRVVEDTETLGLGNKTLEPFTSSDEVAEAFWVPLSHLVDPANAAFRPTPREGVVLQSPAVLYRDLFIWGLTYRVLTRFFDLMELTIARPQR